MAYFAPYIDSTGLHMPVYTDIRDQLIADAKNIFGQDIYLGIDSQDYQFIVVIAEKIYDTNQIAMMVYNNRGPNNAIDTGLDSIVKINGIKRKAATYSTCIITISGKVGTTITNGIVTDISSIKWDLPITVTIPALGSINALATCEITGPIVSNPGDITEIFNPTYGWSGVYNSVNGELGSDIEDDSLLRVRQSNSTAEPSETMLEGTKGAIAQITGVTRSVVYENDTNIIDSNGLPPHSITVVVEGGGSLDIANAIFVHKGIGCYTNGTTRVDVTDSTGQITSIGFDIPDYTEIDVIVNIKKLTGYTTETSKSIKTNLQTYLNSLEIGNDLSISSLWGVALQAMPNLAIPMYSVTSITASAHGGMQSDADVVINYNNVCRGNINYITTNVI